ncbi:hypothetical protein [Streptomyces globisporus]|uniref:hypothetical protein n=1 Tax=Streptomyces globisporus TaxID=1908 RepID=UPI00345F267C|nr:hypothetical protein OG838_23730 [Streptomyces globisporus]
MAATLAVASPRTLAHRLPVILTATAERLEQMTPQASMSAHARHLEIQLSVWDHHGVYNNVAVGRDITAALAAIRDVPLTGTRAQYAARLRVAELHRQAAADYAGRTDREADARNAAAFARAHGNASATTR